MIIIVISLMTRLDCFFSTVRRIFRSKLLENNCLERGKTRELIPISFFKKIATCFSGEVGFPTRTHQMTAITVVALM